MKISIRLAFLAAAGAFLFLQVRTLHAEPVDARAQMWPDLYESTNKEWVDYAEAGDSLSRVDFEKGRFEVQALILVPPSDAETGAAEQLGDLDATQWERVRAAAQEKIARQVERMLTKAEPGRAPVLNDQILDPDDKFMVEAKHSGRFTRDHLIPQMVVEDKPVIGADHKPRLRVKVQFDLIPEHMMVRARRYKAQIAECAKKFDLEPALIYAVIHSESFFDPMSTSKVGARGLMQLMPGAASEADRFVSKAKKERPISAEVLYDPETNIKLGSAYMHMLQSRYFSKIKNHAHRTALGIAAYNCGPFYVIKRVVAKNDLDALSSEELLALLRRNVPRETKYYVPRVLERMAIYKDM